MEVILKKDFISLGYEGDICKVKDGYARNYLIPRNIAVIKNAANLRTLAQMQKSLEKKRAKRKMEAEILKGKIVDLRPRWNDSRMHPVFRSGKPFVAKIKL